VDFPWTPRIPPSIGQAEPAVLVALSV